MDLNDALTMPFSQFRDTHLGKLPLFSKNGKAERLKSFEDTLGSLDASRLIQKIFPQEPSVYIRGSKTSYAPVMMPPRHALSLYEANAGTLVFLAHAVPPWIDAYLEQIPHSTPSSNFIFASRSGGLKEHFDNQDVLSIQLAGTRRWSLWSPSIWDPSTNHPFEAPPTSQLSYALHGHTFPGQLPAKPTMEVTTEPGSVLYIPRGWWHAAAAGDLGEPSMHITVAPNTRNSLELVSDAVVAALSRHRNIRAPLYAGLPIDWDAVVQDFTKAIYDLRDAQEEPEFELGARYSWSRTAFCYIAEEIDDKPAMLRCGKLSADGTDEFDSPLSDPHKRTLLDWLKQDSFVPTEEQSDLAGVLVGASIIVRAS